jgi:hypothetical protein
MQSGRIATVSTTTAPSANKGRVGLTAMIAVCSALPVSMAWHAEEPFLRPPSTYRPFGSPRLATIYTADCRHSLRLRVSFDGTYRGDIPQAPQSHIGEAPNITYKGLWALQFITDLGREAKFLRLRPAHTCTMQQASPCVRRWSAPRQLWR